jgi:acetyl esterase/lipase
MSPEPKKGGCLPLLWRILRILALLVLSLGVAAGALWLYLNPPCERTDGIVYGSRNGHALTFGCIQPKRSNGLGVVFIVSGGWKSHPRQVGAWMIAPLLRSGYTVFAVSHVSQPQASVPETVEDMHRAVRFIRHHSDEYHVDPDRLGVIGASAGGHLSLMLATRGGPGPTDAPDPVDRESSAVRAVAIFFPVTNLLDLGTSTENLHDGGPPKSFRNAFGPDAADLEKWKAIATDLSPVFHTRPDQPPVLIVHGDADTLTPLEQSVWFREASAKSGAPEVKISIRPGKGHGWPTIWYDTRHFARWFDEHLRGGG